MVLLLCLFVLVDVNGKFEFMDSIELLLFSIQLLVSLAYIIVLYLVAIYDYRHLEIRLSDVLLLCGISSVYMITTGAYLGTLVVLVFMLMIFAIPCFFSFGFGDLLVFVSMSPFLAMGDLWLYLGLFFGCWFLWQLLMIYKKKRDGSFVSVWDCFRIRNLMHLSYPLVPVILVSFIIWSIFICFI